MKVSGDLGVERCNFCGEGGHDWPRWQHDGNRAEVLFADFGEGRAGGTAFDFSHVCLAPVQHKEVGCVLIALDGDEPLIDSDRHGSDREIADGSARGKQERSGGQQA